MGMEAESNAPPACHGISTTQSKHKKMSARAHEGVCLCAGYRRACVPVCRV